MAQGAFAQHFVRLEGNLKQSVETGRNRLIVAGALFAIAFAAVGVRLIDVTLLKNGDEPRLARMSGEDPLKAGRADIRDRNGVLLATSLETASLYANPHLVDDPGQAAARLARTFPDLDRAALEARLASEKSFVWIKRHLTPQQMYEANRLGIPGVDFAREERRIYPLGSLAAHVIGYSDVDNRGLAGIERHSDEALRTRDTPLQLSLDVRVQHALEAEVADAMSRFKAIGAAGIVLDVNSGEILGMVSLPDFDPNRPATIGDEVRFNRATLGVYEMGSTFKIFTTAMALDAGRVTMNGGYDATEPIRISRFVIRDYHAKRRWLSVPEIFEYSSNIGAAKMALDVGVAGHRAFLGKLGLLDTPSIEVSEVGAPLVPARWREINTMTIAFGHGLAVSPIQTVAAAAAMINGGILYPPTLIKRDRKPEGKRVISERTSEEMRKLFRLVVEKGTGKAANAEGYLVGGKTGTAEKTLGKRYSKKALMSSFVGAFPMNKPRYIVYVMVDEPQGTKETHGYATGGWTAAPAVSRIVKRIAPMLGVPPIDEGAKDIQDRLMVNFETSPGGVRRVAAR
jgi:cell division protein FtsI (penicillin-binding protein 3)